MRRYVYCRRCDVPTTHAEDASWAPMRWQCVACKLRSFDDELEVAHGLYLLRPRDRFGLLIGDEARSAVDYDRGERGA